MTCDAATSCQLLRPLPACLPGGRSRRHMHVCTHACKWRQTPRSPAHHSLRFPNRAGQAAQPPNGRTHGACGNTRHTCMLCISVLFAADLQDCPRCCCIYCDPHARAMGVLQAGHTCIHTVRDSNPHPRALHACMYGTHEMNRGSPCRTPLTDGSQSQQQLACARPGLYVSHMVTARLPGHNNNGPAERLDDDAILRQRHSGTHVIT